MRRPRPQTTVAELGDELVDVYDLKFEQHTLCITHSGRKNINRVTSL